MNQILSTSNNTNNNKNAIDIKKVIAVFCAVILIFGLAIAGEGIYNIYKESQRDVIIENLNKPELYIEELEDGNVKISAKYDQGLSRLSYIWDDTDRTDTNLDGKTTIEKLIEIPYKATSVLKVVAVGTDGREETISKEFTMEGDSINPVIDWVVSDNLNIIATDETEIAYLTYRWAGDEEVVVKPTTDKTKIDETIEIKRGTNELTVVAVDAFGNSSTKTRTFKGVKEPEISWSRIENIVEMSITHDMGFKKIIFIVNGVEYIYDRNYANYNAEQTEVKFKTELKEGDNSIIIKAYSNEDSEKIKEGKAVYTPNT